jgi:hypothetical protein
MTDIFMFVSFASVRLYRRVRKAERQEMTTERDYSSAWQAEAASKNISAKC